MQDSEDYASEDRTTSGSGSEEMLFDQGVLRSPLDELEGLLEKRRRGFEGSSSEEPLRRLERAYALAREALLDSMESGDGLQRIARDRIAGGFEEGDAGVQDDESVEDEASSSSPASEVLEAPDEATEG